MSRSYYWEDPAVEYLMRGSRFFGNSPNGAANGRPEELLLQEQYRSSFPLNAAYNSNMRPWSVTSSRNDLDAQIVCDQNKFQANVDVCQFEPEEITVKLTEANVITVEGKHEEKEDKHGSVSRYFVRKLVVPVGYNVNNIDSKLSTDGVLTVTVPKLTLDGSEEVRNIPVIQTGMPSRNNLFESRDSN